MRAYYEIETHIPVNHQLNIQLPDTIPSGKARIAVIYEIAAPQQDKKKSMTDFLNSLPDKHTGGLSRDEIDAYINQERSSWDD